MQKGGSQGWVLPGRFPQLVGAADGLGLTHLSGSGGGRRKEGPQCRFNCCWKEPGRQRPRTRPFTQDCGSSNAYLVPYLCRVLTWFLCRCDFSKRFMKISAF